MLMFAFLSGSEMTSPQGNALSTRSKQSDVEIKRLQFKSFCIWFSYSFRKDIEPRLKKLFDEKLAR